MTPFEFVFGLMSIITSLAIAHLIGGIVLLVRPADVRFSWQHAIWVWVAFGLVGCLAIALGAPDFMTWLDGAKFPLVAALVSVVAIWSGASPRRWRSRHSCCR